MSKPDWKDAPEWANFVAMDEDGEWYWFEDSPYMGSCAWHAGPSRMSTAEDSQQDWRETLEQRA